MTGPNKRSDSRPPEAGMDSSNADGRKSASERSGSDGSDSELERLILEWVDGRISDRDAASLQERLLDSAAARTRFRQFCHADAVLRDMSDGTLAEASDPQRSDRDLESTTETGSPQADPSGASPVRGPDSRRTWYGYVGIIAVAAAALFLVSTLAYQIGRLNRADDSLPIVAATAGLDQERESTLSGYATLRRAAEIRWAEGANWYRAGDVLPGGILELKSGIAEIDFFCGATIVVQGPAKLDLESDWSVRMLSGSLRANVPPPARGFVVKAADSEIVDLGTEFALRVEPNDVRVEVIEGEVKLRGGDSDGTHLFTGQGQSLKGTADSGLWAESVISVDDVRVRYEKGQLDQFGRWKEQTENLRVDPRLIAYYPMLSNRPDRRIINVSESGSRFDGALVGPVQRIEGRFGPLSSGLAFGRTGSRARVLIDGEFSAFTFATWVKIDSLEHRYNALFMGDGYENGEPHWQVRDDGRLMFSVMVDDSVNMETFDKVEQKVVKKAGRHALYISEPIWDLSKAGQWLHVVAVYHPAGREVVQYVNGNVVGRERIRDPFFIESLRIGPAELGNWGQPFRKSPWFAVRNLNGTIDELAIYNAALDSSEIQMLFERGKPMGY